MSSPADRRPLHERTGVRLALVAVLVLSLLYALLIARQILLWVVVVLTAGLVWYVARLVAAMEEIATQLGRLVEVQSDGGAAPDDRGED